MKFKKTFISLASVAALTAPVAAVVACGTTKGEDNATVRLVVDRNAPVYFVGDGGSLTDKSFNENALLGTKNYATTELKQTWSSSQAQQPADASLIANGYKAAVAAKANVILGSGFKHEDPAKTFFTSKGLGKNQTFIGIDCDFTSEKNNRLASIVFPTQQAGYLAGIYAVQYLNEKGASDQAWKTAHIGSNGKYQVASYGGLNILPVSSWMDGMVKGIEDANKALAANQSEVEVIYATGTSATAQDFIGGFGGAAAENAATQVTQKYLTNGADIIFPVAGPMISKTIAVLKTDAKGTGVKVFGVDGDQYKVLDASERDYVIGSALKDLEKESFAALKTFYDSLDKDSKVGDTFINEYVKKAHVGGVGFVFGNASTVYTETLAKQSTVFDSIKANFDKNSAPEKAGYAAAK